MNNRVTDKATGISLRRIQSWNPEHDMNPSNFEIDMALTARELRRLAEAIERGGLIGVTILPRRPRLLID